MAIKLENQFKLNVAPERAWDLLNDIERIAPCVPGAQLTGARGDEYQGKVKVKLGPITAEYAGVALISERDPIQRRLVVSGKGRDVRGQGTAGADLVMTIAPSGSGSEVRLVTDVQLTGKVAQLGRGVMNDVAARLIDQFVANLDALAPAGPAAEAQPAAAAVPPSPTDDLPTEAAAPATFRPIEAPEPQPIDLVRLGGAAIRPRDILIGLWMVAVLALLVLIYLK